MSPSSPSSREEKGEIVAHTMLSRVQLEGPDVDVLILTPMSVRPDRQRQGVGQALVEAALAAADELGEPLVLVEGVPSYYPQFGFCSATELGLERPDPRIPEAAWMVRPLRAYDASLRGRVVYPSFFPPPPGLPELPEVETVRRRSRRRWRGGRSSTSRSATSA